MMGGGGRTFLTILGGTVIIVVWSLRSPTEDSLGNSACLLVLLGLL